MWSTGVDGMSAWSRTVGAAPNRASNTGPAFAIEGAYYYVINTATSGHTSGTKYSLKFAAIKACPDMNTVEGAIAVSFQCELLPH